MELEKQEETKQQTPNETIVSIRETTVTDAMYKTVANDLRALSRSVQEPDKAAQAHRVSQRLEQFNELNPAPQKQQHQILQFLRAKEQLLAKERNKEKGIEQER